MLVLTGWQSYTWVWEAEALGERKRGDGAAYVMPGWSGITASSEKKFHLIHTNQSFAFLFSLTKIICNSNSQEYVIQWNVYNN